MLHHLFLRRVFLLLFAMVQISCLSEGEGEKDIFTSTRNEPTTELRYNAYEEPTTLDPTLVQGGADALVARQLFEGLVSYAPRSQEFEPALSDFWTISDDKKLWTFHLRAAKWSDGIPLVAADFAAGAERILRPSTLARQAQELYALKNAKLFHEHRVAVVVGKHVRPRRPPFVVLQEDLSKAATLATLATFASRVAVDLVDSNLRRTRLNEDLILRKEPDEKGDEVALLRAHQDALIVAKKRIVNGRDKGVAWVQLRLPAAGQAGWAKESALIVVFPELNYRRVEGERRYASRVPLRMSKNDHAEVLVWIDDDQEIEVLRQDRDKGWLFVHDPFSGKNGFLREENVDNEYGDRHWFFVRTQSLPELGGDGRPKNSAEGWLPARALFRDASLLGIYAENENTLKIELVRENSAFLSSLTSPAFFPLPRHILSRYGEHWTRLSHIVSNGPFILEQKRSGDSLTLKKSTLYWDLKNVALETIQLLFVVDEHTALNLMQAGMLDAVAPGHIPVEALPMVRKSASYKSSDLFATYFLRLNMSRPPFDDERVRRAFSLAVDKKMLNKVLLEVGTPATHLVPPGARDYPVVEGEKSDVKKARKLLAAAGFVNGKGFPRVEYLFHSSAYHQLIAEVLQAMWREALGVEITLVNQEWKTYIKRVERQDYHIAKAEFQGRDLDPLPFLEPFFSSSMNNHTGFSDAFFDKKLLESASLSGKYRNIVLAAAEAKLNEVVPLIPLFFFRSSSLVLPQVQGLAPNRLGTTYFKKVHILDENVEKKIKLPALSSFSKKVAPLVAPKERLDAGAFSSGNMQEKKSDLIKLGLKNELLMSGDVRD